MRIRRGDTVQVIAGDDAGSTPRRVMQVLSGGHQVLIEGVNRVFKHVRRGHPKSPRGGRLAREMPIDTSNVMLYCEACSRGVRIGYRISDDGSKGRYCKSCGGPLGAVSPPKSRRAK
jgi:large subunit ribosomal protein L24